MTRGRPLRIGTPQVSIRVLLPKADYDRLQELAAEERSDVGTLVRRAIARYFFVPSNSNTINHKA